jgi:hypothetical protein
MKEANNKKKIQQIKFNIKQCKATKQNARALGSSEPATW